MTIRTGQWEGPAEGHPWPEKLTARVITPGARPRVHGYDVEADVAPHYRFGESILLALTGEPPDQVTGTCFEAAMTFFSPLAITEAPTHAAVIARACAGSAAAVTGTAAVTLAEQARWLLDRQASLIAWLDGGRLGTLPDVALAVDDDERQSVIRLRTALGAGERARIPPQDIGRDAAVLCLLHACGLRNGEQMLVAIVTSRLATSVAEAFASKRGGLRDYPLNLPPFAYEEEER